MPTLTCPKCGLAQETPAGQACRGCANVLPAAPVEARAVLPLAARIAGAVLLLNGIASVFSLKGDPLASHTVKSAIADLIIGGGLVAGQVKLQKWAIIRVVLGLVLFGGIYAAQRDMTAVVVQLGFSAALLLLLIGDAAKPRMAVGVAMSAAYLLLAGAGVMDSLTGSNPLGATMLKARDDVSAAAGKLTGAKLDYCLDLPPQRWFLRSAAITAKDNPDADRWVVRPDIDAHVMVVADAIAEDKEIDPGKFEEYIVADAQKRIAKFEMLGKKPIPGGTLLHFKGRSADMDIEFYRGVFAEKNHGYQVVAWAQPAAFQRAEPELAGIVGSFRTACGASAAAPR